MDEEVLTKERTEPLVDSNKRSEPMGLDSEAWREHQAPAIEPDSAPERRHEGWAIISVDDVDSNTIHNILYPLYWLHQSTCKVVPFVVETTCIPYGNHRGYIYLSESPDQPLPLPTAAPMAGQWPYQRPLPTPAT
jgi:hypothetical protein